MESSSTLQNHSSLSWFFPTSPQLWSFKIRGTTHTVPYIFSLLHHSPPVLKITLFGPLLVFEFFRIRVLCDCLVSTLVLKNRHVFSFKFLEDIYNWGLIFLLVLEFWTIICPLTLEFLETRMFWYKLILVSILCWFLYF